MSKRLPCSCRYKAGDYALICPVHDLKPSDYKMLPPAGPSDITTANLNDGPVHAPATQIDEAVAAAVSKVDRFEVIDDTGRAYVKGSIYGTPVSVELSLQDDGRTLKVFVRQLTAKQGDES